MAENKSPSPNRSDKSNSDEKDDSEGTQGPHGSGTGKGPNNQKNPNFFSRGVLGWILLGGLLLAVLLVMNGVTNQAKSISISAFLDHAHNADFDGPVIVKDSEMIGKLKAGRTGSSTNNQGPQRVSAEISPESQTLHIRRLLKANPDIDYKVKHGSGIFLQFLLNWGPFFLIAFLIYFFIFRSLRNAGGGPGGMLGNFGRSKHKVLTKEHSSVTLSDAAGIEEAKEEVTEIIEFLKNPKRFQRLGGRVPRGMLLMGPPGCGKTLLAKGIAGEADVPFYSISGSDFVEMFVGVGASRVRDLFKQAKENAPCIIFLDEIDAVGRRRGGGTSSGGHDEREQTLNAILVEMDGFDTSDQVIVIASTNRGDVLDPALTRPGRFDRQVQVPLPDVKGRAEIFKVHSRKVKLAPDVDLEKLARGTPMFSGAELEAVINEAAISATLQNKDFVDQADLEEARDKVKYGKSRKSQRIEEEEKQVIAYHEAGHAVLMYFDPDSEPLHKVTILPRGPTLGSTMMLPEKDRQIMSKKRLLSMMRVCYGGRIAEEMFTGDQYNGTAGDIRQATNIARSLVTEYGMSDKVGFRFLGDDESRNPWNPPEQHSDETTRLVDQEVKKAIDQTYNEAYESITEHKDQLESLAKALLRYETLSVDEVEKVMQGEQLDKATVTDLLQAEKGKDSTEEAKPAEAQNTQGTDFGDGNSGPVPSPA